MKNFSLSVHTDERQLHSFRLAHILFDYFCSWELKINVVNTAPWCKQYLVVIVPGYHSHSLSSMKLV